MCAHPGKVRRLLLAVTTYRRPEMLRRLLTSIQALRIPADVELSVCVVDNDRDASARHIVTEMEPAGSPIRYTVAPARGIANARNHALTRLGMHHDFLAFIDDDEWIEPGWLEAMLETQRSGDYDVTFGPVLGTVPPSAPRWMRQHGWFCRKGTGRSGPVEWNAGGTGNVLLKAAALRRGRFYFNPGYNFSGAEDTDLFFRMRYAGATFGWAAGAIAHEEVEPNRCTLRSLLRRQYRGALQLTRILNRRGPVAVAASTGWRMMRGLGLLAVGVPLLVLGRPTTCIRGLLALALAAGGVVGNFSARHASQFVEYGDRPEAGENATIEKDGRMAPGSVF